MRLPGLGPKTARRHLAGARDHDRRRPAGGRRGAGSCAGLAGLGREARGEDPRRARASRSAAEEPQPRAARHARCRSCARSSRSSRRIRPPCRCRSPGSARRFRETVRDLDLIATATDPRALLDAFCSLPWVVEVAAKGDDEGDRRRARRPALRPARRPARVATATCSSTSPARRTTTSRCARRPCGAASRSPSTAITEVETGEVHSFESEEEVYALPRLRVDPARAARERRRARGGARRRAAEARRARATCAATCTRTRPGRTARTRSRRWSAARSRRATPTTRSATTRTACATSGSSSRHAAIDALQRAACRSRSSRASR